MKLMYVERAVPYEKTVHEHRAPTDESIRLYDEIKEKAYNSILHTIEVGDNKLGARGIIYKDFYSFDYIFSFEVKLNGQIIADKVGVNEFEAGDKYSLMRLLYTKLAEKIAEGLFNDAMKDAPYLFRQKS